MKNNAKKNAEGTVKKDNRKTEPRGLIGFIFSILGAIPVIGMMFAVLAVIFGAVSLAKIKRDPEKYKGKGFAIASIAIGCAMIVFNIVFIANSIQQTHRHVTSSTTSCHA